MEWHSFPLLALYRLVQGQLILLLERTSNIKWIASTVDDMVLRQKLWAEDISLEDGALRDLETRAGEGAKVMRLYLGDILKVLLVDVDALLGDANWSKKALAPRR